MKGHEYLTSTGILHRDISENNIVLGLYPWQGRGYLIDLDMAILQEAEEPTRALSTQASIQVQQPAEDSSTPSAELDKKKHMKGLRTVRMLPNLVPFSIDMNDRVLSLTFHAVY